MGKAQPLRLLRETDCAHQFGVRKGALIAPMQTRPAVPLGKRCATAQLAAKLVGVMRSRAPRRLCCRRGPRLVDLNGLKQTSSLS